MALSDTDKRLLEKCLRAEPRSWEDFTDRFIGLVFHVIDHTAKARSIRLSSADRDDLCAEVFLSVLEHDFRVLRNFKGNSSLATYMTVITRRVVVKQLMKKRTTASLQTIRSRTTSETATTYRTDQQDEVESLLSTLAAPEAEVVRMYHLEGKTYQEISASTGVPENSIGPTLSRARSKMRQARTE
ncbi:MAG: sigma-70 family RNA polymerase sigma factor [Pirellulaceae bacterium]